MRTRNPFSIAQRRSVKKEEKGIYQFVGAELPQRLAEQVTLWALYYKVSKSTILERLVEGRIPHEKTPDDIIDELVQRALNEWKLRQVERGGKSFTAVQRQRQFSTYLSELRRALSSSTRKGLHLREELVELILRELTKRADL